MRNPRHLAVGAAALAAALAASLTGLFAWADGPQDRDRQGGAVHLRLLGVNDFHGHLQPLSEDVGGAAWLAAHLDAATIPGRTIRVHAGDMVGASPLISAWFHDEPTIAAVNGMGFDVGTLGNHEFDEGAGELLRLLRGGQRSGTAALKADGGGGRVDTSSPGFRGAGFPYTAANTVHAGSGRPLLPPYWIAERAGVKVGFIGITTRSTARWVLPRYADRFRFLDLSASVNRWVPRLQRQGVEAIVVLAHAGAPEQEGDGRRATGEIVEESREMSDAVDVVVAGHSHSKLDLRVPNRSGRGSKLVVEAGSYGAAFDRVDLTVDRRTGEVLRSSGSIVETSHSAVAPDPDMAALVASYASRAAPVAERILGSAGRELSAGHGLGELAARAQLRLAGTDVALVNRSSFRGTIDAGAITFADVFEAQAYDHRVLTLTMSGADVLRAANGAVYMAARRPIDPRGTYTVAANELFATRGGLAALATAARQGRVAGTEVEALSAYLGTPRGR